MSARVAIHVCARRQPCLRASPTMTPRAIQLSIGMDIRATRPLSPLPSPLTSPLSPNLSPLPIRLPLSPLPLASPPFRHGVERASPFASVSSAPALSAWCSRAQHLATVFETRQPFGTVFETRRPFASVSSAPAFPHSVKGASPFGLVFEGAASRHGVERASRSRRGVRARQPFGSVFERAAIRLGIERSISARCSSAQRFATVFERASLSARCRARQPFSRATSPEERRLSALLRGAPPGTAFERASNSHRLSSRASLRASRAHRQHFGTVFERAGPSQGRRVQRSASPVGTVFERASPFGTVFERASPFATVFERASRSARRQGRRPFGAASRPQPFPHGIERASRPVGTVFERASLPKGLLKS
ncbi:hypothetical protein K523DRAFT_422105 [Schizophyllum commune Tattone D]|nr:hypothetical protein K523DRAFT_422105 [Schizophyllum commune Tattone D]